MARSRNADNAMANAEGADRFGDAPAGHRPLSDDIVRSPDSSPDSSPDIILRRRICTVRPPHPQLSAARDEQRGR
jgi:hypothetical protein